MGDRRPPHPVLIATDTGLQLSGLPWDCAQDGPHSLAWLRIDDPIRPVMSVDSGFGPPFSLVYERGVPESELST